MNLQSPLFDAVRIPARASLARLIERVCKEHGVDPATVRQRRAKYLPNVMLDVRRDILAAARAAKYPPTAIGNWFGHRDGTTVTGWMEDMGID